MSRGNSTRPRFGSESRLGRDSGSGLQPHITTCRPRRHRHPDECRDPVTTSASQEWASDCGCVAPRAHVKALPETGQKPRMDTLLRPPIGYRGIGPAVLRPALLRGLAGWLSYGLPRRKFSLRISSQIYESAFAARFYWALRHDDVACYPSFLRPDCI